MFSLLWLENNTCDCILLMIGYCCDGCFCGCCGGCCDMRKQFDVNVGSVVVVKKKLHK